MRPNMRLILLASGAALVITVIALSIFLKKSLDTVTLEVSKPLGANAQYPHLLSAERYQYFTGSAFAEFNIPNQTSTGLTPIYRLPNVVDVRWADGGALFKANDYSEEDQLYSILDASLLPTDHAYWWYVDFKTGAIRLAGHSDLRYEIQDARWSPDGKSYMVLEVLNNDEGLEQDRILTRVTTTGATTLISSVKDASLLASAHDQFAYYTSISRQLKKIDYTSKKASVVIEHTSLTLSVSPDSNDIVYIKIPDANKEEGSALEAGELVQYSVDTKKTTTLNKNFSGQITQSNTAGNWSAFGTTTNSKVIGYTATPEKTYQLNIKANKDQIDLPNLRLSSMTGNALLLRDENNQSYLATPKAVGASNLPDQTKAQKSSYQTNFYTVYDQSTHRYTIYILRNPYQQNIKAALTYLKDQGVDPYQLDIKWYAYDDVDPNS